MRIARPKILNHLLQIQHSFETADAAATDIENHNASDSASSDGPPCAIISALRGSSRQSSAFANPTTCALFGLLDRLR
jgi:hypothetical protein